MIQNATQLTIESLAQLAAAQQPPCLSLYQTTHRHHPENQQDPIRFRNLVKELETSLQQRHSDGETRHLVAQFEALSHDHAFWAHTLDGLAVLGGPATFRVFRLQRAVPELAVVADSFHTRPLRQYLQSVGRYQVLGLSLNKIELFEGTRDSLDKIEPASGVPRTMIEALGSELTDSHQTVASGTGPGSSPIHHADGGRRDEVQTDAERFFRAVDQAALEHHSRPTGLPLILASLPEHQHLFHQVRHNPFLAAEGITIHPDALPIGELCKRAWRVVEAYYHARLATLVSEFEKAKSGGLGSDNLVEVPHAAAAGRVATLSVESDRELAGWLDASTGDIEIAPLGNPQVDDLLDDLGELVAKMGGQVFIIPAERMPTSAGLAATYHY